jgi:hypothetical protein
MKKTKKRTTKAAPLSTKNKKFFDKFIYWVKKIKAHPLSGTNLNKKEKAKIKKALFWKYLMIAVFFLLVITIEISVLYVIPDVNDDFGSRSNTINCSINFPLYAAPGDEKIIELTLTNMSGGSISDVKSFLIWQEKTPIIIISNKGSSVADFGTLKANEKKTTKIKFVLNRSLRKKEFGFTWKVVCGDKIEIEKPYKVGSYAIPYIQTITRGIIYAFGSALAVLFMSLVAEKAKKFI